MGAKGPKFSLLYESPSSFNRKNSLFEQMVKGHHSQSYMQLIYFGVQSCNYANSSKKFTFA